MRKSRKSCGFGSAASGSAVSGTAASKAISTKVPDMISYMISRKEIMKRAKKGIQAAKPPHSGCSRRTRAAATGLTIFKDAPKNAPKNALQNAAQNAPCLRNTLQDSQEKATSEIADAHYVTFLCDIKMSDIPDSIVKAAMALDQDNLYAFRKSLNCGKLTASSSALDIFTNWLKYSIKRNPRARTHKKIMGMPLISQLALSRMFAIRIILDSSNKASRQSPLKASRQAPRKAKRK